MDAAPLIGSRLSVLTKSQIGYEGVMCNLDIASLTPAALSAAGASQSDAAAIVVGIRGVLATSAGADAPEVRRERARKLFFFSRSPSPPCAPPPLNPHRLSRPPALAPPVQGRPGATPPLDRAHPGAQVDVRRLG